jgi:octaprenyl-diphosphate synthase
MIGKTLGTDLEKGKFTLPLLLLLEKIPLTTRDDLLTRFRAGDQSVAEDFIRELHNYPIFEEVVGEFEDQLAKATDALAPFGDLPPTAEMKKIASLVRAQLGRIA